MNNIIAEDGLLYSTDRWLWDHIKSTDKMEIGMIAKRIDPETVVYAECSCIWYPRWLELVVGNKFFPWSEILLCLWIWYWFRHVPLQEIISRWTKLDRFSISQCRWIAEIPMWCYVIKRRIVSFGKIYRYSYSTLLLVFVFPIMS